jgi:hypothetical protein
MGAAAGTQGTLVGARRRSRRSAVSISKDFVLAREGELFVVFLLSVHGKLPLYHFRTNDTVGRNLAMVDLARHHGQPVTSVAKAFGLHRVTLHGLIERFEKNGSDRDSGWRTHGKSAAIVA